MREGPNTANRSHTLDTIPETQDLDLEVVLPNINIGLGHLPYEKIVDPNATTLPMHSTPGTEIRLALVCNQWILNTFLPYLVFHHRQLLVGINPHTTPYQYFTILNVFL